MLGVVKCGVHQTALTAKYGTIRGESWWIIAVADQRMRSERMERIRRELEAAVAEGRTGDAMGFDPKAPATALARQGPRWFAHP